MGGPGSGRRPGSGKNLGKSSSVTARYNRRFGNKPDSKNLTPAQKDTRIKQLGSIRIGHLQGQLKSNARASLRGRAGNK
jgi:hypothetical protein